MDEVDNFSMTFTVTLFEGFDAAILDGFRMKGHIAAAEEKLRTHDQFNDAKRGPIVEIQTLTPVPGSSVIRLRFKPDELLEGYPPQRVLRLFGNGWHVDDLPREEAAYDG